MRAAAARANKNSVASAKAKVLPPARSLGPSRGAGRTLGRVGGKPAHESQRFVLPKGFRRSDAMDHPSVPRFAASPEPSIQNDSVISAAALLKALQNLPHRQT